MGCPQIPRFNIRICPSNLRPKISICSDHSAPSFSRSRIFHNCTMQQKKQRVNHPSTNKNGLQQNPDCKKNQTDFFCVFLLANPLEQPKELNWHLYLNLNCSKPQLLNLDPKNHRFSSSNLSPVNHNGLPYHQLVPSVPLTAGGWWPPRPRPGTCRVEIVKMKNHQICVQVCDDPRLFQVSLNQQKNSIPYQSGLIGY